jgi:hypothetical protein
VRDGVLPKPVRRRWDLPACVRAFVEHKVGNSGMAEERVRLTAARRREIEQRTRTRGGELVEAADATYLIVHQATGLVAFLDALPTRVSAAGAMKPAAELTAIVQREVYAIRDEQAAWLERLAAVGPEEFSVELRAGTAPRARAR